MYPSEALLKITYRFQMAVEVNGNYKIRKN